MEIVFVAALAIAGMIWAFFRGKDTQVRNDMEGEIERDRERNEEEQGGVEEEIDEIDERLDDNQAREITGEDAINILRDRYGWGDDA